MAAAMAVSLRTILPALRLPSPGRPPIFRRAPLVNPLFPNGRMCFSTVEAAKRDAGGFSVDKNVLEEIRHIIEIARRASSRRETLNTDFLTPTILKEALEALEKLADVKTVTQGGYPQAERCRLSIGQPEMMETVPDIVSALRISGNFGFEPCSHGDFLGAILGTGIVREKIGDILLQGEKGAQVLVVPELVDYLKSSLNKVGNVSVSCAEIPLLSLEYEPPRTNSFRTVEASLRVDALASAGFKISRTKLADLISKGDVRVNWSTVMKNGTNLKTGDVVSVSGKGRLKERSLLFSSYTGFQETRSILDDWGYCFHKEGEVCSGAHSLSVGMLVEMYQKVDSLVCCKLTCFSLL